MVEWQGLAPNDASLLNRKVGPKGGYMASIPFEQAPVGGSLSIPFEMVGENSLRNKVSRINAKGDAKFRVLKRETDFLIVRIV